MRQRELVALLFVALLYFVYSSSWLCSVIVAFPGQLLLFSNDLKSGTYIKKNILTYKTNFLNCVHYAQFRKFFLYIYVQCRILHQSGSYIWQEVFRRHPSLISGCTLFI